MLSSLARAGKYCFPNHSLRDHEKLYWFSSQEVRFGAFKSWDKWPCAASEEQSNDEDLHFFLHLSKKFFTLTWLVFWTGFSIGWGILQLSSVAWPRKIHATLGNPGATVTRKPNAPDSVRGTTILARLTRFPSLLTRCGVPKKPTSQTSYTGVFKLIMATEILLRNINKMQFGPVWHKSKFKQKCKIQKSCVLFTFIYETLVRERN